MLSLVTFSVPAALEKLSLLKTLRRPHNGKYRHEKRVLVFLHAVRSAIQVNAFIQFFGRTVDPTDDTRALTVGVILLPYWEGEKSSDLCICHHAHWRVLILL